MASAPLPIGHPQPPASLGSSIPHTPQPSPVNHSAPGPAPEAAPATGEVLGCGILCPICLLLSGERVTRSGLVQVRFCAVHAGDMGGTKS
jgi:hypothetical protein